MSLPEYYFNRISPSTSTSKKGEVEVNYTEARPENDTSANSSNNL